MELCLITDKPDFALEAEQGGIERIMLDLESRGKLQRQTGQHLFLSTHVIESVPRMRAALKKAALVVRINPLNDNSTNEIEAIVRTGVDLIMLPYFQTIAEVRSFLSLVNRRAKTILLVETKSAVEILPALVRERLGDEIHIGLNDLRISLGHGTIFEPFCNGMLENVSVMLRKGQIPFGVGGIARLSRRDLPVNPERVLAEQIRLGAGIGWLGRSFRGEMAHKRNPGELVHEVNLIRTAIQKWASATEAAFVQNRNLLFEEVGAWQSL